MAYLDGLGLERLWNRISSVFARQNQAGGSLSWSGTTLGLNSVSGGSLSSVDLSSGLATDSEAGHSLSISGTTLTLKNVNDGTLNSVTLPSTDVSGKADANWVKDNCVGSIDAEVVNKTLIIRVYDLNGNFQDSASVSLE